MKREMVAKVGADGTLTVSLPMGLARAGRTMRVVVEAVEEPAASQEERLAVLKRVAGSIDDPTFIRHPQAYSDGEDDKG